MESEHFIKSARDIFSRGMDWILRAKSKGMFEVPCYLYFVIYPLRKMELSKSRAI